MSAVKLCPKYTKASPCSGSVVVIECTEDVGRSEYKACGEKYDRCEAHGGLPGARRSLKSHRGIYHPAERP